MMHFARGALRQVGPAYAHCRKICVGVAQSGWRPLFGWLGLIVGYYTYIFAPSNGIAVDPNAANFFLSLVLGAFVTRGAERHLPGIVGALVNREPPEGRVQPAPA